jgi:HEAT repeat protein
LPGAEDRGGRQSREPTGIRLLKPIDNLADALDALHGTDEARRQQAADWLAHAPLDPGRQAEVARALERLLDHHNSYMRRSAARALIVWGDKESVPALVKALDQRFGAVEGEVQRTILEALGRLADERGAEAVAPFLANAFMNEDARRSLKAMGPAAEKAVLKYYFHPDGGARERAADLLRGYGTRTSAIVLQGALELKAPQLERRRRAVQWFAQAPVDAESRAAAARGLEPLLQDTDQWVREQAVRALITWATPDSAPGLRRLIEDQSANLRRPAMEALGKLKDEDAVTAIAVRLLDGGDRRVAGDALIAIGPKSEGAVLSGLNNPDRGVRIEVCRVLGAVGTKKCLAALQTTAVYARTKRENDVLEAALLAIDKVSNRLKAGAPGR